MNCKFCNTENPDNAAFCKACGARLDGNIYCYACGTPSPADSEYCTNCGRKLLGGVKKHTKAVGVKPCLTESAKGSVGAFASKVLNKIAVAASLICSVFAIIFVFLICVKLTGGNEVSCDISFYFKDCYKHYNRLVERYDEINQSIKLDNSQFSYYYPDSLLISYIFGTLILAAAISGVVILACFSIIYSVFNLCGKTKKNGIHTAIAAFIVYILGSSLMLSISAGMSNQSDYAKFNSATLAGISLCSIFAIVSVGCNVASKGRELINKQVITDYSFAMAGMIITAIVIGLASAPIVGDTENKLSYLNTLLTISVRCTTVKDHSNLTNANTLMALCAVSTAVLIVLAVCAAVAMIMNSRTLDDKKQISLPFNIAAFVTAIAVLVLTILTDKNVDEATKLFTGEAYEKIEFDFAIPVTIMVMSVLALGLNIARIILKKLIFSKNRNSIN